MGEIYHKLQINGNRKSVKVDALFDTGSFYNVINYELFDGVSPFEIGVESYNEKGAKVFIVGSNEKNTFGVITFKSISVDNFTTEDLRFTTFALTHIGCDVIIGHPLMQYFGMIIDLKNDIVQFRT
ncbi:MAG: aspartyl protease family protein [Thermoplasmatales archaeon]